MDDEFVPALPSMFDGYTPGSPGRPFSGPTYGLPRSKRRDAMGTIVPNTRRPMGQRAPAPGSRAPAPGHRTIPGTRGQRSY